MLDKKVKVKEIQDLGAGNFLLALGSPDQAKLSRPGQFVMVKCSGDIEENPLLRRPFSIFDIRRHPGSGNPVALEILVKDIGYGTRRLCRLRPKDEVHVLGPQGRCFVIPESMKDRKHTACLVAGGVGIAALLLLARELLGCGVRPVLFYGGRREADLVLRANFERLGIEARYTTEDGSFGERGLVTEALERFLRGRPPALNRVYACGPWGMMKAAHEVSTRQRVCCEVSLEARMGCSLGACMGCVVHGWDESGEDQYLRVCLEGPVMQSRHIDWEMPPL